MLASWFQYHTGIVLALSVIHFANASVIETDSQPLACGNNYLPFSSDIDLSCQIDAFSTFKALKNYSALLVDIRPANQYQKVSIPESINIPWHALKTKSALKNKRLFLIDEGGQIINIALVCQHLKQRGFDVSYVQGGINAWRKVNKNLLGQLEHIRTVDELGPEHFYFNRRPGDILLINIGSEKQNILSKQETIKNFIPHELIKFDGNPLALVKNIKRILKSYPLAERLFIYDDNGKSYSKIKKLLQSNLQPSVFYLAGGYQAFQQFDRMRLALLKKQKSTTNHFLSCRG